MSGSAPAVRAWSARLRARLAGWLRGSRAGLFVIAVLVGQALASGRWRSGT